MDLTGEPDGPPTKSGLSLVDFSGGYVAAISLLAGLHAARRDGIGMDCDVSLYDTAISMLTYPATWHLNAGFTPARTRHSAHPSLVPFQAFEASDGWLVVGLCQGEVLGASRRRRRAPRVGRRRARAYATFAGAAGAQRRAARPARGDLQDADRGGLARRCCYPASIPCGPINDVAAALREEHTLARNLVVETEHPRYGTVRQVASPVRVGSELPTYRRAPRRNEDADQVLGEMPATTPTRSPRWRPTARSAPSPHRSRADA